MFEYKKIKEKYYKKSVPFITFFVTALFAIIMSVFILPEKVVQGSGNAGSMAFLPTPTPTPTLYPGDLDPSFGTNGIAVVTYADPNPNYYTEEVNDLAVQSDGKVVAVGFADSASVTSFAILRFNTDGSLDTGFDSDGKTVVNFDDQFSGVSYKYYGISVAIQSDGKIVVGGQIRNGSTGAAIGIAIARYNTNGSLDTSFGGGDGKMVDTASNKVRTFGDLALLEDNNNSPSPRKIVVVGQDLTFTSMVVATFDNAGGNSCTFSGTLCQSLPVDTSNNAFLGTASSVLTYAETVSGNTTNYIVLAGHAYLSANNEFVIARYRQQSGPSLVQDNNYGCATPGSCGGYNVVGFNNTTDGSATAENYPQIARNAGDGKISLAGDSFENPMTNSRDNTSFARFNSNGTLDTSFDSDGKVVHHIRYGLISQERCGSSDGGPCLSYSTGMLVEPDGDIVSVGVSDYWSTGSTLALLRLKGSGAVDKGFGWNGRVTSQSSFLGQFLQKPVAENSAGDIFVGGYVTPAGTSSGNRDFFVAKYKGGSLNRPGVNNDYDNDGKTDLAVYRLNPNMTSLNWYINYTKGGSGRSEAFGVGTDLPVPGDYDGDARLDLAVFRPSNGYWYIIETSKLPASQLAPTIISFGTSGDQPVTGDYDGDGRDDKAVYRPSNNTWYIDRSTDGYYSSSFGSSGDKPVVGDFDGDGKHDLAYFRPSNGTWYYKPIGGSTTSYNFGTSGDIPAPEDYDADGITDYAVFRPSNGMYYVQRSTNGYYAVSWGNSGDIPVPNDYDGDHAAEVAVWRPGNGGWYSLNITTASYQIDVWGTGSLGDIPMPSAYIYP
jgi:uncharacterized delta-60 repeat protein